MNHPHLIISIISWIIIRKFDFAVTYRSHPVCYPKAEVEVAPTAMCVFAWVFPPGFGDPIYGRTMVNYRITYTPKAGEDTILASGGREGCSLKCLHILIIHHKCPDVTMKKKRTGNAIARITRSLSWKCNRNIRWLIS